MLDSHSRVPLGDLSWCNLTPNCQEYCGGDTLRHSVEKVHASARSFGVLLRQVVALRPRVICVEQTSKLVVNELLLHPSSLYRMAMVLCRDLYDWYEQVLDPRHCCGERQTRGRVFFLGVLRVCPD